MMMLIMPRAKAASVPGRTRRCSSDLVASHVTLGSTVTIFMPRFIRSMTQWP